MKTTALIFGLALGMASAELKVSVTGLQISGEGYVSKGSKKEMAEGLTAFGFEPGTKVGLLVTSDDKTIIRLNEEKSKVTAFTDDQGTDFTKVKKRFTNQFVDFGFPKLSKDGKALLIEVGSGGIPKKDSASVILKGELVVLVASESKLIKSAMVELKQGAKLTAGDHIFEVAKTGKPNWGDDPLSVVLKSNVSHEDFKAIKFYDAEGNEIESEQQGSSSSGMFGKRTYAVSFNLKKKTDKITLGLDTWTDLEVLKVPLDLDIKPGF